MTEETEEVGPFRWEHRAFGMPVRFEAPTSIFDAIEVRDLIASSLRGAAAASLGLCWQGLKAPPRLAACRGDVVRYGREVYGHLIGLGLTDTEIVTQGMRAFRLVASIVPTEQGVRDALHPTEGEATAQSSAAPLSDSPAVGARTLSGFAA